MAESLLPTPLPVLTAGNAETRLFRSHPTVLLSLLSLGATRSQAVLPLLSLAQKTERKRMTAKRMNSAASLRVAEDRERRITARGSQPPARTVAIIMANHPTSPGLQLLPPLTQATPCLLCSGSSLT